MKNDLLFAILGFNAGVIGTILYLFMASQLETGSSLFNYLIPVVVGGVLGGIGYFVGGKVS